MPHIGLNFTEEQLACEAEREWPLFVYSILVTYAVAVVLAVLWTTLVNCCTKITGPTKVDSQLGSSSFTGEMEEWATSLISGQTFSGRILVVFKFCCNLVAMVVFVIDTTRILMEECVSWEDHITLQIDFALGVIFLLLFLLRLLAADSLLSALFTRDTIVDMFTLPPLAMSMWMGRTWLGLRFFRFLTFFNLPDVLVYVRLLTGSTAIRLAQLISIILGFICWAAGMIQLLENTGDVWHDYENAREKGEFRFGDALYYLVITASTVGYGDFFPVTDGGKIFAVFYLSLGIGGFASMLPEIAELMGNQPKYAGNYQANAQKQFVVVCGNINFGSVTNFLADFYHPAREDVNCEVVLLNKNDPDLEFEGLLKREKTRVKYFQGTMLNPVDLQRAALEKAAAVLVLCDKFSSDPTAEDAANIMRVISAKNYCETTRVIVQLLHYHNKSFLLNIPGWDWRRDDQAVCINEVKLGLLAQSCMAPGFFTMASNMMTTSDPGITPEMPRWKKEYLSTSNKVILAETLSPTFVGYTFQEVAEICFLKLNLLLIAMEARKYEGGAISINPNGKKVTANAIGLFISDSSDKVKRAWFYCRVCHENISDLSEVKKCSCKRLAKARYEYFTYGKEGGSREGRLANGRLEQVDNSESEDDIVRRRKAGKEEERGGERPETAKMSFDGTGCFHWCVGRTAEECTLTRQEATVTIFAGHIVIGIFADDSSPLIGLRNLLMPLRASNIPYSDLRHVIIVGPIDFIKKEWGLLRNLPKISVMDGNPLNRADVRAVKVNLCRTCVLLSAKAPEKAEPVLADKEIIMAALNIKSMDFGGSFTKLDGEEEGEGETEIDMNSVPVLLDLAFASNVRYLDDHEMYLTDQVELSKTLPFACGMAMARGISDALMSAAYFNGSALRFMRQWVTGGATVELEKSLAEGAGLRGGYSTPEMDRARDRIRVEEIVLRDSPWARYAEWGARFSELFAAMLREQGALCIGIYRLLEEEEETEDQTRVILSIPESSATLQPRDHIVALVQWKGEDKEKRE